MDQTRVMHVDPAHARRVIEDLSAQAGVPFLDSYSPGQAAVLAFALDYDCSLGTVAELVRKRYIAPEDPEGLSPVDVYCLLGALEARRRWKHAPSAHDAKKSGVRLQIEAMQAQGVEPVNDLDDHTVEDLLLQLTGADNRALREILYETLRLKLKGFEE
jgi:hypothetical protein